MYVNNVAILLSCNSELYILKKCRKCLKKVANILMPKISFGLRCIGVNWAKGGEMSPNIFSTEE